MVVEILTPPFCNRHLYLVMKIGCTWKVSTYLSFSQLSYSGAWPSYLIVLRSGKSSLESVPIYQIVLETIVKYFFLWNMLAVSWLVKSSEEKTLSPRHRLELAGKFPLKSKSQWIFSKIIEWSWQEHFPLSKCSCQLHHIVSKTIKCDLAGTLSCILRISHNYQLY